MIEHSSPKRGAGGLSPSTPAIQIVSLLRGYFFVDKNNLMVYYSFRKFNQLTWKIASKGNGVEYVVYDKNMTLSSLINQGPRAYHRNGLQNLNNKNNQSLVMLDFKPIAGLFFINFFTEFHPFSLL